MKRSTVAAACALALMSALPGAALARSGGGSSYGDSYHNDMQRNPRLIEPGAEARRDLTYYGGRGYDQRVAAEAYRRGYGYPAAPPYGSIRVRPVPAW